MSGCFAGFGRRSLARESPRFTHPSFSAVWNTRRWFTDSSFTGKTIIVTGASSGIGAATAQKFLLSGANVALVGRNAANLERTLLEISSDDSSSKSSIPIGKPLKLITDVTDESEVSRMVQDTLTEFGRIDVLVNSAGILRGSPADQTSTELFDDNFKVNSRAPFLCMQQCIPSLKDTRGCIVNVSSVNGLQSFGGTMAYCASKASLDHLSRCAAVDLAPFGVRVNCVNPGVVRTELQRRGGLTPEQYLEFVKRSSEVTHPLGRIAEAWEIAEAVLFLASNERAGFITGVTLPVDGGRACLGAR